MEDMNITEMVEAPAEVETPAADNGKGTVGATILGLGIIAGLSVAAWEGGKKAVKWIRSKVHAKKAAAVAQQAESETTEEETVD